MRNLPARRAEFDRAAAGPAFCNATDVDGYFAAAKAMLAGNEEAVSQRHAGGMAPRRWLPTPAKAVPPIASRLMVAIGPATIALDLRLP